VTTLPPGTPRQSDWAAPISVEISNLGPGESPTVELVYETAEIAERMGRALDLALEDDAIALFEAVAPRGRPAPSFHSRPRLRRVVLSVGCHQPPHQGEPMRADHREVVAPDRGRAASDDCVGSQRKP
jgi:hypothetical protein